MALDWSSEIRRLASLVWMTQKRILSLGIPLAPAVDAVNSFLLPRMEAGLVLVPLTTANRRIIARWESLLRRACLRAHGGVIALDKSIALKQSPFAVDGQHLP